MDRLAMEALQAVAEHRAVRLVPNLLPDVDVARRWGYLMNMTADSFRTLFDKFARLDLRSPEHLGRSLRLRARLARAEGPNAVLVRGVYRR